MFETVRLVRRALGGRVPLIGFAGAPFTLASYLIEGGASRDYLLTKRFMRDEREAWHSLLGLLADDHRRLPERADRGGGTGGAALRLMGRASRPPTTASSSCPTAARRSVASPPACP